MRKTNAMRLLEQAKILYEVRQYDYDETDLSGISAAEQLQMPPEQIFKTLVCRTEHNSVLVFCIPVCCTLDLKKAAKAAGCKKIELVAVKELLALTGYIRGGCSPIGMKKQYPTYLEETALLYDQIGVSAGERGLQMLLDPQALVDYVGMQMVDLT